MSSIWGSLHVYAVERHASIARIDKVRILKDVEIVACFDDDFDFHGYDFIINAKLFAEEDMRFRIIVENEVHSRAGDDETYKYEVEVGKATYKGVRLSSWSTQYQIHLKKGTNTRNILPVEKDDYDPTQVTYRNRRTKVSLEVPGRYIYGDAGLKNEPEWLYWPTEEAIKNCKDSENTL